jgi:hypothetical protein
VAKKAAGKSAHSKKSPTIKGSNGNGTSTGQWIVMIFMGAGRLEGAVDMTQPAADDLKEISDAPRHKRVKVFVQKHAAGPAMRYAFTAGGDVETQVPANEADPVDGKAVTAFVEWALGQANYKQGDRTMLVIWGHAHQFTVGHVATGTGVDALDFRELGTVLAKTQRALRQRYDPKGKLDLVGFDACDLATVEMAYQLSPYVNYMIASQIGIPIPGWPYDQILAGLVRAEVAGVPMAPDNLGSYVVRKFCRHYLEQPASLTLLDLRRASEVFTATEELAAALAIAAEEEPDEQALVNLLFQQSQTVVDKPFIDVADFCNNLSRYSQSDRVTDAAGALGNILIRPARANDDTKEVGSLPFVLEHGRNNHETSKLQGISLYAPPVAADAFDWRVAKQWYLKLGTEEPLWSAYVHLLAEGV